MYFTATSFSVLMLVVVVVVLSSAGAVVKAVASGGHRDSGNGDSSMEWMYTLAFLFIRPI